MTIGVTRLNSVNLDAVGELAAAIVEEPQVAATAWKATVVWKEGFRSEARIRDFAPVQSDEPTGLGGTDAAPNPVEQLLGALGNCLAVGYAANASAAGIEIRDLRIELSGDLDLHSFLGLRPGHAGYDAVVVDVHLEADADEQQLEQLHEAVIGTSPVGHTLQAATPVTINLV